MSLVYSYWLDIKLNTIYQNILIIYVYCNVFSNYILIYISAFQTTNHIKHPWIQNLVVFFALWFSLRKIPMEIHMIQNQGPKHDPPGSRPAPRVSTVPAPALYIQHWQQSARLNCLRLGGWGEGWSLRIQRFSRSFLNTRSFSVPSFCAIFDVEDVLNCLGAYVYIYIYIV